VVLYEMLTGTCPYGNLSAMELLARAIRRDVLPNVRTVCADIPEEVAYVLSRMMAPSPEDRPQSVREVADLLERAVSGNLTVPQVPEPAAEPPANSPWRQPMFIVALVSVVVALASIAFACCVWCRFLRGQ